VDRPLDTALATFIKEAVIRYGFVIEGSANTPEEDAAALAEQVILQMDTLTVLRFRGWDANLHPFKVATEDHEGWWTFTIGPCATVALPRRDADLCRKVAAQYGLIEEGQ
jgi:hypothetical protein